MNNIHVFGAVALFTSLLTVAGCASNGDMTSVKSIPRINLDNYNSIVFLEANSKRVAYLPYGSFVNYQPYYSICDKTEFEKIQGLESAFEMINYLKLKTPFGIRDLVDNEFLLIDETANVKEVIDLSDKKFLHNEYAPKCPES